MTTNHRATSTFTVVDSASQISASVAYGSEMTYTTWVNLTQDFGQSNETSTKYPMSSGSPATIPMGLAGYVLLCYLSYEYHFTQCTNPVPETGYCYDSGPGVATGTTVNYLVGINPLAPILHSWLIDEMSSEMVNGKYERPILLEIEDPNDAAIGLSFHDRVRVYYQAGQHDLSTFTNPTFLCDSQINYHTIAVWNETKHFYDSVTGYFVKISRFLWEPLPRQMTYGVVFTNDIGGQSATTLIYVDAPVDYSWIGYVVALAIAGTVICLVVVYKRKSRQRTQSFNKRYLARYPI